MKYIITNEDKHLLLQKFINYKYRLYVLDENKNIISVLEGVQGIGNYVIDSKTDTRRTSSFILQLDEKYKNKSLELEMFKWVNHDFKFEIGILNLQTNEYSWYGAGYYTVTNSNTSYSSITNQLSMTLADFTVTLNGTRYGKLGGALKYTIKKEMDEESGKYLTLQQSIIAFLKESNKVKDYIIDDIGEYYGMPDSGMDYMSYRQSNPEWNVIPYDLEFNGGSTILDVVKKICDLYPNIQCYFDVFGNFCVNMIPSCNSYPITLTNDFIQKILVSDNTESVQYNISGIKNVTEVWGTTFTPKRFSENVTYENKTYLITLETVYKSVNGINSSTPVEDVYSHRNNQLIAFTANCDNSSGTIKLNINGLGEIILQDEFGNTNFRQAFFKKENTYVIKTVKKDDSYIAVFCGQYQPHAICVLTNSSLDPIYSKQYFANKYGCSEDNVIFRVEENSPFSVQNFGECLDFKSIKECTSDGQAVSTAIYNNKQTTSNNDIVTITTVMIPFLDVETKVTYKRLQETEENTYIIKSIDNNLESMTSTITMYRFYPL